ncbi:MAG: acyl-CoA dehydratase activase [Armatimonadota bacterium]
MLIRAGVDIGSDTMKAVLLLPDGSMQRFPIRRVQARPLLRAKELFEELLANGLEQIPLALTGSGGVAVANAIGATAVDEPVALTAAVNRFYPQVRTLIEMGRECQKLLVFEQDERSGRLILSDCDMGDRCAAGGGAFLEHMAVRLNFGSIEEFAQVALHTEKPASLSGRCSVFTESDIVHLYQKGTPRERIAAGIHQAICRNFVNRIARSKQILPEVVFIGGVAENPAMLRFLAQELGVEHVLVPEHRRDLGALGAALCARQTVNLREAIARLEEQIARPVTYASAGALRFEQSQILAPPARDGFLREVPIAALGVDIGSVSTKAALVTERDGQIVVLASYYRRTDGDPLSAVRDTISQIHRQVQEKGYRLGKVVAATTGSGRYLTGDFIGADLIRNEITAQASGTLAFIRDVDTILEIGGQDSKYIRLDGDVVVDYEMNKACAAGCGAFLEKQAAKLGIPIEEFGDRALRAATPPHMDWTCTVFTESAMVYFQQVGVPVEELCAAVCLAAVHNYLSKNVGGRPIGERVAFQGAVAFNKGMVAAFETVLGKRIIVPPYPHLTGAIGVARLALKEAPQVSRFRGFEQVAEGRYQVGSFECRGCANACDVNTFQIPGGRKFFYNDRCERFGSANRTRSERKLPDLFAEREEKLLEIYNSKPPEGAPRIGVPRVGMFYEYFPLYKAFFTELGFEVVPSDKPNRHIVRDGLVTAHSEFCFPVKAAHGHLRNLLEKGVDILFVPGVISAEQPDPHLRKSLTCPYLQALPELLATYCGVKERGVKYLAPRLHFQRGERHLRRVFTEVAKQLGKSAREARRALKVGLDVLSRFRTWQRERGLEILDSLGEDETAFVVVGRPYVLYDETVNTNIGKKIRDMGILPIPQDFLPINEVHICDPWKAVNPRQIQRKLAVARIVREDPRLRAVVLTYFGCGPDSFGNPFFKDELNEPCCVLQIDEHTADAGIITRLEAFADTVRGRRQRTPAPNIRASTITPQRAVGRRVWVPYASEGAKVIAAALRACDVDAEMLPRSPDPALKRARTAITEDVCLPAFMTTEDILYRVSQPDFDPEREAFFMGSSDGPCRFGMYHILQKRILEKMGLHTVDMVTLGTGDEEHGLGTLFAMVAWDALVAHDLLQRMLYRTRPYAINPADADAIYLQYLDTICAMLPEHRRRVQEGWNAIRSLLSTKHLEPLRELLAQAQEEFRRLPKREERRPLIGVVGEFYVRIHEGANQDVVRRIEALGGEAWLAPATEFFAYANCIGMVNERNRWLDTLQREHLINFLVAWINHRLAKREEHTLVEVVHEMLGDYLDISADEVIRLGSPFVHPDFGGEAICSLGKAVDFAQRGLAGIVAVRPFGCMPGNVVAAFTRELRRRYGNIPMLNLDYDGFVDASRDMKLAHFLWQVKERWKGDGQDTYALVSAEARPFGGGVHAAKEV